MRFSSPGPSSSAGTSPTGTIFPSSSAGTSPTRDHLPLQAPLPPRTIFLCRHLSHQGPSSSAGTSPTKDHLPLQAPLPPGTLLAMSQTEVSTCSVPHTQRVFQEAVRKGNTKELQSLLQNMTNCEFNVNSFGPEGQTALHQSVIDGNLELVKLLVKFGADIRLANRDGWSALHIAAYGGHQDIVLYLITKAKYSSSSR